MITKDWGIDITGRKMWYIPWPVDNEGNYCAPDEKEIEEIYGISGEAVSEILIYFEECGGDTLLLIELLNTHTVTEKYRIARDELLDHKRWYTNEYYFYFIMFTKKIIGRYDFHFGENNDEQLSVYHKIYEKGFLNNIPWGARRDGSQVHDQGLTNIIGPLLYLENTIGVNSTDFILFINLNSYSGFQIDRSFFNNQTFWVSAEFSDFAYELLKILSNSEKFLRDAAFFASMKQIRLTKIIANVPNRFLSRVISNATSKSNEVFNYDFKIIKSSNFVITASPRKSFNINQLGKYQVACLLNRLNMNIGGFTGLLSLLYGFGENPDKLEFQIMQSEFGFRIKIAWMSVNKYIIQSWVYSIIIPSLLNLVLYFLFNPSVFLLSCNYLLYIVLFFILFRFKFYKKDLEKKLFELHESSMEQMDALEKTSAILLKERNLLELKVTERTAELAAANEKLRDLDRAKTDFFANISHELRTPLTLILAPVEAALAGKPMEKDSLELVHRSGSSLLSLINDLLEVSRITAGRITLEVSETDACRLLGDCCAGMESAAKLKGITLSCNTPGSGLPVWIDKKKIAHVISNLFSNSFKFTEPGGSVDVSCRMEGDHIIIRFGDTGCGIPADKVPVIFERFVQADTGSTRHYEGTGIGLSLVRDIVELHGGSVSVESRYIEDYPGNHGSLFTVKIPSGKKHLEGRSDVIFVGLDHAADDVHCVEQGLLPYVRGMDQYAADALLSPADASGLENDSPAVLVVEDNRDLRNLVAAMLTENYVVYTASNGREAISVFESGVEIDLVLSDIMMPGMDGHALLKWMRGSENFSGIPFIFLTARADSFMKLEGLQLGAVDYVTKPFNSDELLLRISNQIEQKKLRNILRRNYDRLLAKLRNGVNDHTVTGDPVDTEGSHDPGNNSRIEQVCSFINEHYTQEITRDDLAAVLNLNPDTFSRLFNQYTGTSLNDYISRLRIEEAKKKLAETDLPVTRISYETGFDSIRTFNRAFKKITGMSPMEYRERETVKT